MPKYICDVNLEVGIRLRTGEVNPLFGFDGGGQQYDLIINGKNVGTFTNERIYWTMIEIQNNKILLDGKKLQFDNKIIEAAEHEGKVVIVFED